MVVDRRPQIFEFPPGRRRNRSRHFASLMWLGGLPRLRGAEVGIGPAVGAVYIGQCPVAPPGIKREYTLLGFILARMPWGNVN